MKEDVVSGYEARMVVRRNAYKILVGKPERKRSFGRPGST
jgi:hypothetical protein